MHFNQEEKQFVNYLFELVEKGYAKLYNRHGRVSVDLHDDLKHDEREAVIKGAFILAGIPSPRLPKDFTGKSISLSDIAPVSAGTISTNVMALGKNPNDYMRTLRAEPKPTAHSH